MEEYESFIKQYLIDKELTDIEFYNIADYYFSPDPDHTWVIGGGVEFTLGEEKFSFGYAEANQFYNVLPGSIEGLTGDLTIENLEAKNAEGVSNLLGHKIVDAQFKWNFYQEFDEDFELKEEKKYMPFEIILHFDEGSTLQLSTVVYEIRNQQLKNLLFDSQGHLLISLNKPYEISMPQDISEEEEY